MAVTRIELGASPYLEPATFNAIKVGDTVVLRHENPTWVRRKGDRSTAEKVSKGGVMLYGAWYYERDGWTVEVLVTPDTVDVWEPSSRRWSEGIYGGQFKGRQEVRRSIADAASMAEIDDFQDSIWHWDSGRAILETIDGYVDWVRFAKAVKRIGSDTVYNILKPVWDAAVQDTRGEIFRHAGQESDARKEKMQERFDYYGFKKEVHTDEDIPIGRFLYWLLSFAFYDGAKIDTSRIDSMLNGLGVDLFVSMVNKGMSADEVERIALEMGSNGVDHETAKVAVESYYAAKSV